MRWRKHPVVVAALAATLAGGGCEDAAAPLESSRQLGVLQYEGLGLLSGPIAPDPRHAIRWRIEPGQDVAYAPNAIEAPDTVAAGQAFTVRIHTVGPDGCWRAAGMDMARAGRTVELTPWDEHSGAEVCTQVLGILRHDATLVLNEKGEWTLRAKGRRVRRGEGEQPVTAERTLVVR